MGYLSSFTQLGIQIKAKSTIEALAPGTTEGPTNKTCLFLDGERDLGIGGWGEKWCWVKEGRVRARRGGRKLWRTKGGMKRVHCLPLSGTKDCPSGSQNFTLTHLGGSESLGWM